MGLWPGTGAKLRLAWPFNPCNKGAQVCRKNPQVVASASPPKRYPPEHKSHNAGYPVSSGQEMKEPGSENWQRASPNKSQNRAQSIRPTKGPAKLYNKKNISEKSNEVSPSGRFEAGHARYKPRCARQEGERGNLTPSDMVIAGMRSEPLDSDLAATSPSGRSP